MYHSEEQKIKRAAKEGGKDGGSERGQPRRNEYGVFVTSLQVTWR